MEFRVGQGQAKKGAQKLIVGGHWGRSLLRKRIDPDGSPRWLRRLPCGWCQIPRTFPSGPSANVTRASRRWQSLKFVAWLRRVAVRPKEVTKPAQTRLFMRALSRDQSGRRPLVRLANDVVAKV